MTNKNADVRDEVSGRILSGYPYLNVLWAAKYDRCRSRLL